MQVCSFIQTCVGMDEDEGMRRACMPECMPTNAQTQVYPWVPFWEYACTAMGNALTPPNAVQAFGLCLPPRSFGTIKSGQNVQEKFPTPPCAPYRLPAALTIHTPWL